MHLILLNVYQTAQPGSFQELDRLAGELGRPAGELDRRPAKDLGRPAGQLDRPAGELDRPAGDLDRPAGELNCPAGELNRRREAGRRRARGGAASRTSGRRRPGSGAGRSSLNVIVAISLRCGLAKSPDAWPARGKSAAGASRQCSRRSRRPRPGRDAPRLCNAQRPCNGMRGPFQLIANALQRAPDAIGPQAALMIHRRSGNQVVACLWGRDLVFAGAIHDYGKWSYVWPIAPLQRM